MNNTKLTLWSCYLAMFVQAALLNMAAPLFIPLKEQFGLSFEQIGRLILVNFTTQVIFDILAGVLVDRLGAKPFAVAAQVFAFAGLWLFALLPGVMRDPYHGLVIGTIVFSMGAGILEMLLSPIVNAMPSERKAADMSLLHSFYAVGQVLVIFGSAMGIYFFGSRHWWWIVIGWSVLPAVTALGFSLVRIPPFVEEHQRHRLRQLIRTPAFVVACVAIGLAGATELAIAQWISAFAERGLGFAKIHGDLMGLCLFGVMMAVGRVWFGIVGEKHSVYRTMIVGAWASLGIYFVACLSPWPTVSLAACVAAGFTVSLLWPGVLSVTAARFPLAGASMFAMLSAAGDVGGAVVPWAVGAVADRAPLIQDQLGSLWPLAKQLTPEQLGLRTGLLLASICPFVLVLLLRWLHRND